MSILADSMRAVLIPFLAITGALLLLLLIHVLALHAIRGLTIRRRVRLLDRYRPLVAAVLHADDPAPGLETLRAVPRHHVPIVSELLLNPLRHVRGAIVERALAAAHRLGLIRTWESALRDRRWWIRAEAAHALGLVEHAAAVRALIGALDDPIEDVRSAAVQALGRIGDPAAVPALVGRLSDGSRHQPVRLIEALQRFGTGAVAPLLEHARTHSADLAAVADLLGRLEAAGAVAQLVAWCNHDRADVRAAAVRAVGTIGADDRAYYHLLRALSDEAADVRAAAAWSLGRSGREDAAGYLAARLHDDWIVAVDAASALRALGGSGRRALEAAATLEHGELARQMLWETHAGTGA